ncbi:MAG: hypothetical protein HYZ14_16795 [Bacteroidetes bacterium]|nr:hypothetical protein [Bacteroidota bacterium]
MIQKLAEHRIAFLLLVTLLLVQLFSVDLNSPYRKPINGDAQAYYAYLPAIFIYQDLDYSFVPEMQQKYYTTASAKSFLKETTDGEKVNKTFPGVTVLYLPFFLAAHATSLLFGLPADGYAFTYQLFYLMGFWFYFLLGMIFFRKVLLQLNFTPKTTNLTLLVLVLATNLFFYTVYDQSVTHIYSFFLINWALWLLLKLKAHFQLSRLILLASILALIGITRPTNILVLGVFFFFVPEMAFYKSLLNQFFRIKNIYKTLVPVLLLLSIPFILWKLQTGKWIVYSYGNEGFDFLHPQLFNFLFSYTKGWLVYTPVMAFVLPVGFILLFHQNKKQFFIGLIFLLLAVYIFSSWWCWYYGAGLSQRVMMDFYILPGFLLALIFQKTGTIKESSQNQNSKKQFSWKRPALLILMLLFICVNTIQAWQISNGILPFGSPTREQYWDNFLVLKKRAQVYPQQHWVFVNRGVVSLNSAEGQILKGNPVQLENNWCLQVNESAEYSAVAQIPPQHFKKGCKLIVSFESRANTTIEQTRVVFQLGPTLQKVFLLKDYISADWEKMQYLLEIDDELTAPVDIYLWNAGSGEHAELRNLSWELYFD